MGERATPPEARATCRQAMNAAIRCAEDDQQAAAVARDVRDFGGATALLTVIENGAAAMALRVEAETLRGTAQVSRDLAELVSPWRFWQRRRAESYRHEAKVLEWAAMRLDEHASRLEARWTS